MVRTTSAALGLKALLNDLGHTTMISLLTDASPAKGISQRTGLGKVQDLVSKNLVTIKKVRTNENLADICAKHADAKDIEYHMTTLQSVRPTGRHPLLLTLT